MAVTLYGIPVVALLTGIVVGFYNELLTRRATTAMDEFISELEHLPDLSRDSCWTWPNGSATGASSRAREQSRSAN